MFFPGCAAMDDVFVFMMSVVNTDESHYSTAVSEILGYRCTV